MHHCMGLEHAVNVDRKKNAIPSYIIVKEFLAGFFWIFRPQSSKIPSCAPESVRMYRAIT